MEILSTPLAKVYVLKLDHFTDDRGSLTKIFTEQSLTKLGLPSHFPEHFFSVSRQGVIRGMHGQKNHTECAKLIYVSVGKVLDVVLDTRVDSPTFKQFFQIELSEQNHNAIFVPEGCLHGFMSMSDNTHTVYLQTKMRDPNFECGVRFYSFGMDWGIESPLISERDKNLPTLNEFVATLT